MDNQQGKIADLAWLAGFIDGEGHIGFRVMRGKRLRAMAVTYYNPNIRICNTDQPTLQTVTDILDANGLPYHISHRRSGINPKWLPAWDLEVDGLKRCKRWLEVITPYLRTKQHKAILMSEFIALREEHVYGADYTEQEKTILSQLRNVPLYPHRLHAETA